MGVHVTIASSRTDQDSAVDEDLTDDLRTNEEHTHDSMARYGTDAAPVRLVCAEGRTAFTMGLDVSGDDVVTETINLNDATTDALDGNPNFLALRNVVYSLEEDTSGSGMAWSEFTPVAGGAGESIFSYLKQGPAITAFQVVIVVSGGTSSGTVDGFINWIAYGTPVSGE